MKRNTGFALLLWVLMAACETVSTKQEDNGMVDGHPSWMMQGNIYEVNIRQYTPEGTFKAFAKHLDRLREMGVQTLWLMPINPISKVDRKGSLGSYYAVSDYKGVNPEYGTMEDFKNLVKEAHAKGFKLIIDWVPNHTGADHPWLTQHPDFFVKDSITGKAVSQFDWTDTRKLNYQNKQMQDSMMSALHFWISEADIDGYRCDVAGEVPDEFWVNCIKELKSKKNVFMLAEADKPSLHTAGFDASYAWNEFAMMKLVASGMRKASALDSSFNRLDTGFAKNALRLMFTSNHDENSWNKADFATMPGAVHAPFAVLTQTMKSAIPLIYSGQEEPTTRAISFFEKDTIEFSNFARSAFYTELLALRKNNPALAVNASYQKLSTNKPDQVFAYVRRSGNHSVTVILNLSAQAVEASVHPKDMESYGTNRTYHLMGHQESMDKIPNKFSLAAWGYQVIVE